MLSKDDAMDLAKSKGLDLVEVAPDAKPPVCRIMDYGKFKYEQTKKEKEAKKKQVAIKIKEIKIRPTTDVHDFEIKREHAKEFLEKGHKVKVTMMFRGREMMRVEDQKAKLIAFSEELKDCGVVEREPKLLGRNMIIIIGPLKKKH